MDKKWITDEVNLWNQVKYPGTILIAGKSPRQIRMMPHGKHRTKLLKKLDDKRADKIAAEWKAFERFMAH